MKAIALGFHDVIEGSLPDASGFPGPTAARYKIDGTEFDAQMSALAACRVSVVADVKTLGSEGAALPVLLTFDDGGSGALAAADRIERRGWRGHFFVTAGRIGTAAFLDKAGVRALHERGHVVGTHSWSHPERMSSLGDGEQMNEWRKSTAYLSDILGAPVDVASVPGGYYDQGVARAAARAGLRVLFTSEPTARLALVDGCLVAGRFAVMRGTSPRAVAAIAAGRIGPRVLQSIAWNAKKAAKSAGGEYYLRLRKLLIGRGGRP
ncbi:MAG TPA: polysaccharide deacetylase family protein [Bacteroidota bacterium]|nr:polysaccharide deacetylase family protein [Bacteroidota bacterium]